MFGDQTVPLDKFMRSLQFESVVNQELESLSEENKTTLAAYSAGINAYVEKISFLPIEFMLLGVNFEKWTPKDSLMIYKLIAFQMSGHWQYTSLRTGIAKKYGQTFAEILVPYEADHSFIEQTTIIQDEDVTSETKKEKPIKKETVIPKAVTTKEKIPENDDKGGHEMRGSNAWAISGKHTETQKPMLGSDPHLGHHIPSEMYLCVLKFPNGPTITGATICGLPAVIIGRNEHVAWGITMSMIENVDLFSITMSSDKKQYYYNNTWRDLKIETQTIKIKGAPALSFPVYKTHHGPILDYPLDKSLGTLFAY